MPRARPPSAPPPWGATPANARACSCSTTACTPTACGCAGALTGAWAWNTASVSTGPTTASIATSGGWCCWGTTWCRSAGRCGRRDAYGAGRSCAVEAGCRGRSPDLLDDAEVAAAGWGVVGPRTVVVAVRRRRGAVIRTRGRAGDVLGQDHALPRLAGVDRHHRGHRHVHRVADAAEAGGEADRLVVHLQPRHRALGDVEHDLAVLDRVLRNTHARQAGVDQYVRRHAVVHDPLVQRPQQVRAVAAHRREICLAHAGSLTAALSGRLRGQPGSSLSLRSAAVRLRAKPGLRKMRLP